MAAHNRRRFKVMLGGIAILVIICSIGAQQVLQELMQPPTAAPFLAARTRWEQRPFQQYRLVINRQDGGADCQQTLDVAGTAIQTVVEDTCSWPPVSSPPQTVDQLFADLEAYTLTYPCGPNGCGCDSIAVSVTYHPQWGYPQQVRTQQQDALWWQRWQGLLQRRFACTLIGAITSNYTVDQLIPSPTQP